MVEPNDTAPDKSIVVDASPDEVAQMLHEEFNEEQFALVQAHPYVDPEAALFGAKRGGKYCTAIAVVQWTALAIAMVLLLISRDS